MHEIWRNYGEKPHAFCVSETISTFVRDAGSCIGESEHERSRNSSCNPWTPSPAGCAGVCLRGGGWSKGGPHGRVRRFDRRVRHLRSGHRGAADGFVEAVARKMATLLRLFLRSRRRIRKPAQAQGSAYRARLPGGGRGMLRCARRRGFQRDERISFEPRAGIERYGFPRSCGRHLAFRAFEERCQIDCEHGRRQRRGTCRRVHA